jgi:hypothetical protein
MEKTMNVRKWVGLFKQIGLTDDQMHQWHKLFEAQYPDAHEQFLKWLGMSAADIEQVRSESR